MIPSDYFKKNVDDGPPFDLALRDGAASGEKPLPAVTLHRCACGARAPCNCPRQALHVHGGRPPALWYEGSVVCDKICFAVGLVRL